VSTDAGLPVPRDEALRVTAVNDQHAYLAVPDGHPLAVGDVLGFGISHPCTTFDKWRALPIVSADGTVLDLAITVF
jgi:D-serine deaminase-like pyridoxal phosphate-dependent protein